MEAVNSILAISKETGAIPRITTAGDNFNNAASCKKGHPTHFRTSKGKEKGDSARRRFFFFLCFLHFLCFFNLWFNLFAGLVYCGEKYAIIRRNYAKEMNIICANIWLTSLSFQPFDEKHCFCR